MFKSYLKNTESEEPEEKTYKIMRHFQDLHERPVIAEGLTLQEAQEHCDNDETSSRTATNQEALERTKKFGIWFDAYTEE